MTGLQDLYLDALEIGEFGQQWDKYPQVIGRPDTKFDMLDKFVAKMVNEFVPFGASQIPFNN